MSNYSDKFKETMVSKLSASNAMSAGALSLEVGVPQSTLSRWVREYVNKEGKGVNMKGKRPQDWTAEEKLEAILEMEKLDEQEKGKYLREKGLHTIHVQRWKQEILDGLKLKAKSLSKADPRDKRIKELEKELNRKDKALAETAALLVLKKKAEDIWGDREGGK
jgi:transposase